MNKKALKRSIVFAILWMLLLAVSLTSATYAWFTFVSSTKITPMYGKVSGDGVNLLISNNPNGPFDKTCALILTYDTQEITPVTTADLTNFFLPRLQDKDGIPRAYSRIEDRVDTYLLHGTVYIKAEESGCFVYLADGLMDFGSDIQAIASMRLGLSIRSAQGGTQNIIFRLDDFADTTPALSRRTVEESGTVYNGLGMVADPARDLAAYMAYGDEDNLRGGGQPLFWINANEVVPVEFWLYLEGCDDNCYNPVQTRDIALSLGFGGVEH